MATSQVGCYVQPDQRRKGIGSKLCKKARELAKKTGESIAFQDEEERLGWGMCAKSGFIFAWRNS